MSFGHLGWWISFQKMGGADISGDNTGDITGNSRARGEPTVSSPQRPICSRRRLPLAVRPTHRAIRVVADKALTDKQMTVLPVRISGQVKPLIDSVSRCYLLPQTALCELSVVPNRSAEVSRTAGGLILYGTVLRWHSVHQET